MKVEVKEIEELVREVSIEIEPDVVSEKLDAKFAEVQRAAKADGFRRGKVPMRMIKTMYGDDVKFEVSEDVIKTTLPKALRDKELRPASTPTVTSLDYTAAGGIAYRVKVEVFPEIKTLNLDDLVITSVDIEVTDEDVDRIIESVRKTLADRRDVDRPASATDVVTADLEKVYDPNLALDETSFPESTIDLSDPVTVKEFKEHIPGMSVGDEKEIEVSYDKDYPDARFAGAQIRYQVKVKNIQEQVLPVVDDLFAKSTGQAETVLELRLKVRDNLERQKNDELRRYQKNEMIKAVCEQNKITMPNGLINEYLEAMVEDAKSHDPEIDEAQVRSSYHGVAVNTLRWNLLYNHIAKTERIEVLPSDTEKVVKRFAANYNITEDQAKEMLQQTGRANSIRDTLLEDKVLDFLLGKAKIVKKEQARANIDR